MSQINLSELTNEKLNRWNNYLTDQNYRHRTFNYCPEVTELHAGLHEEVIAEMKKRNLPYTIKFEKA